LKVYCEFCGTKCRRDSYDSGFGIMYGPWGCPECRWSEDDRYDLREGAKFTKNGYRLDQYGGAWPPKEPNA